jgi:lysophospholipase L1-like esterase
VRRYKKAMLGKRIFLVLSFLMLAACSAPVEREAHKIPAETPGQQRETILAMGDSMMAWNGLGGNSIADVLADEITDADVVDKSVVGARIRYILPVSGAMGMSIPKQFRADDWDWIVVNGGGNDLWLGCACEKCDKRLDALISRDGTSGSIPEMVARMRQTGARVIYLGYLTSPGVFSLVDHCRDEGQDFETRLAAMASHDDGVHFLPLSALVPEGDRSFHAFDMIHPSVKGSRVIGQRVAGLIRQLR